jgi:hypothetical protein
MPRTKLTQKYGKPATKAAVEIDEATLAQRAADTARWLEDNEAALEEGRRALELELAEADRKKRKRQRKADTDAALEPAEDADEPWPMPAHVEAERDEPPSEAPCLDPVWSASATMAIPPRDPDDPRDGWQVLDITVELYFRHNGYEFTLVMPDGTRDVVSTVDTRDGWAQTAAYRGIKIAEDADWAKFNALQLEHPIKELRRQAQLNWIAQVSKATQQERGERGPRELYRDRDVCTGEFSTWSDGCSTWR